MDIVEALGVEGNLVCVVGAGGKKTTLYTLANRLDRAVVTATVRIPIFDRQVTDVFVTDDPASTLAGRTEWPVGVVPAREGDDRYRGYDPDAVDEFWRSGGGADTVLVKADGARTRWLKAPNDREPQLPRATDVVIPIASAKVVGKPLTEEYVHRVDRVAALTGLDPGDTIEADHVAGVLASDRSGLKDVPDGARVVPLVNMADDEALAAVGREIAEGVLRRADVRRVVVAQMNASGPLVEIVE